MNAIPLVVASLLTSLAGCGSSGTGESSSVAAAAMLEPAAATIRYRYRDSSVPPPGHRSYTLLVTPDASRVSVDEYGTVLTEAELPTDLDAVGETLRRLSESDLPESLGGGCGGSPSLTLEVSDASGASVRRAAVTPCREFADEARELREIVDPVLAPFEIDALVGSTRP